ncbi:MAG: hypothetical protein ACOCXM_07110 [Myxococcota bacterium]
MPASGAASLLRRSAGTAGAALGLLLLFVGAGGVPRPAEASDPDFPALPVAVGVARTEEGPAVDRAWIETRLRRANRVFASAGVRFVLDDVRALPAAHGRLDTHADRHALRDEVRSGVINVFVVASLRDVDDPSRFRQGVHWRPPPRPGAHYVILSAIAQPDVLGHELGHFFGNHGHSDTPGNIMSYDRGDDPPFFDAKQKRTIHHHVRRFLRTGQIRGETASR